MTRFVRLVSISLLAVASIATGLSRAQTSSLDELHQQLESARAEISAIQGRADTVEKKIDSIAQEEAAVGRALEAARDLVERTQAQIAVLRLRVADEQRIYDRARAEAEALATGLYKTGPVAELEVILTVDSLSDIDSVLEYASAANSSKVDVMLAFRRTKARLDLATSQLEAKLEEAKLARDEQVKFSQHLADLRRAQEIKLSKLRREIAGVQKEADAIAAESARIQERLAVPTAVVPTGGVSAGGFAWPITGTITSGYGERWGRMHTGIDIDCVTGDPIRASKAGTIVSATYDGSGYGYYAVIDHGDGFATLYAHMSELYISGGSVAQGETIGACGSTGASTGDHVHFEVRVNGAPQDPLAYLP